MKKSTTLILYLFFIAVTAAAQTGLFIPANRFSSSLISSLCQDKLGSVWVGTDYGLNRFDGYNFQTFLHDEADTMSIQTNAIVSLLCDDKGQLWVGTNRGLDRFDSSTETFIHYRFPNNLTPRVSSILQRKDGTILVGTAGYGAYCVDKGSELKQFSVESSGHYFSRFFEDSRGRLWRSGFDNVISMRNGTKIEDFNSEMGNPQGFEELDDGMLIICQHGIMAYRNGHMTVADADMSVVEGKDVIFSNSTTDSEGNIYIGTRGKGIYRISSSRPRRLESVDVDAIGINEKTAKVSAVMFDRNGNLWIGCHHKGLLLVHQNQSVFHSWSFESQGIRLGSTVSSVCEGDNGIVWCTVQDVGVFGFNSQGRIVARPSAPDAVEFIFRDKLRRFWLGSDDGLYAYDPTTGQSKLHVKFDCDKFNDMTSDADGNIYISTFSRGFCIYNPQTGLLRNHSFDDTDTINGRLCNNWIMGMSSDSKGRIWMATSSGVACYEPKTQSFRSQGWESILSGTVCFDVCELHSGQLPDGRKLNGCIAIATESGLYLYDPAKHSPEPFPGGEKLKNKAICYVVQSNDGNIWCSTSMGIWQYALDTHTFIGHISGNGLIQKEYIYGVGMHTDDNLIYFGNNDGFTIFSPDKMTVSQTELSPIVLTAFQVGDMFVKAGTRINGVEVTDRSVNESNYFTLSYLDHTVTMAFSQFDFNKSSNVIFEYRVNGGSWVSNPAGKNDFTLGHLQPGTYRIEVRAHQRNEYTQVRVFNVTVRAPWYRSLTAYFIYLLLLAALGAYLLYTYRRRTNRQLNEEKMKFLINATHDIRSPLTLILGALKKIEKSPAADTIERNSQRILNLVNQILDVRKIDKQQMQLHCQPTEMVAFVKGLCKMYEFNAKENNISFRYEHDGIEQLEAWVDRNQFDKVVSNLLSNAFKYNREDGGEVVVRLFREQQDAQRKNVTETFAITVTDNGIGLDTETMKHIFDRFYQGRNARHLNINSTGIGLNLCKMIVDMHHGTITATNRTDGIKGSVFTVRMPLGNAHLKPEEMELPATAAAATTTATVAAAPAKGGSSMRHRVLIVDDDVELARFISTELSHYYKFHICENGKEGLKELLTGSDYAAVVSDVMMPEMDGFTMLRMIKTNLNIAHIPVIMLTSMADVGNRLEGLERGADAFLAKPFDMEELHLTIDNLIQSRQRLKGKFTGAQQQADKLEQPEVKGNDEQLMERIMKAVNKNLSDSDFNVEMLTQEVGISRAQLHRKMKEMTGLSTSEFIRNIRLEQAARLLKEQKINVTQVAYTVGFSNLAHFSTIFRKHFGVAPSEYGDLPDANDD